ncbi:hypothetical protein [Photorhabdus luminescens]|uniref:hypothetical protein n=1 Tax=Photorhabdus luminescens TaxID=29488 RepID=UPI00159EC4A2|nr:hypothetical protein [Photorhabdus luminescens]
MKKNYAISSQIISTIEISSEPRRIKNSSSNFIYGDSATKKIARDFKQAFDYIGIYDHELP